MKRVRVIPVRAANERIQGWAVEEHLGGNRFREVVFYCDRGLALTFAHRYAALLGGGAS